MAAVDERTQRLRGVLDYGQASRPPLIDVRSQA